MCAGVTSYARRADECEIGDLSGKYGEYLNVPSTGHAKLLYTDLRLPLTGHYSIVGRSIVVHGAGGAGHRVACAGIALDIDPPASTPSGGMTGWAVAAIVAAAGMVLVVVTVGVRHLLRNRQTDDAATSPEQASMVTSVKNPLGRDSEAIELPVVRQ